MRTHVLTTAGVLLALLLSTNDIVLGQAKPSSGVAVVDGITWAWKKDFDISNACSIMPQQVDSVIQSPIPAQLTIPSRVNGMDVVGLLPDAFRRCETLEEVTLPPNCVEVGSTAFKQCKNLRRVVIPDGSRALTISTEVFALCPSLKEIHLSACVQTILDGAFKSSGLEAITIPGNASPWRRDTYDLPYEAFVNCPSLKSVDLLTGIKSIHQNVFARGTELERITIPSSVKQIGFKEPATGEWGTIYGGTFDVTPKRVDFVADAEIPILDSAFGHRGDVATLYVRKGEKSKVEGKAWAKAFSNIVEGHLVTFKDGGEVFAEQLLSPEGNESARRPGITPWKEGKYFKGWFAHGEAYDFSRPVGNDLTLEAGWGNRVTFDANGGEFKGESTRVLDDGEKITKPDDPTKAGCVFQGWYESEEATDPYDFDKPVSGNVGLVAVWDKYTVTFDPNGGTLAGPGSAEVARGGHAEAPAAPTKGECQFLGWAKAGAIDLYQFDATPVNRDITLVARWDKYTVTFDPNGGAPVPAQQAVGDGQMAQRPDEPTKEGGYRVKYWTTEGASGQSMFNFMTRVTTDLTLTAVWVKTFEVQFDCDGGTPDPGTSIVDINTPVKVPVPLVKLGFNFKGWALDGKDYDFSRPITQNITLRAIWEKPDAVESQLLAKTTVVRNPVGDVLEIQHVAAAERLEVYSLLGVPVHRQALHGEDYVAVATNGWPDGVYLVRVVARDGQRILKIVVRR